jgi:RNA recognition motif-containing protein
MTSPNSTLWMGNIEKWMNHVYLYNLLKSSNIYPNKIIIKNYKSKRGCAFLEFFSPEMAKSVLTEHNNKIVNGVKLQFNWVHSLEQRSNLSKITKFTVRKFFYFFK